MLRMFLLFYSKVKQPSVPPPSKSSTHTHSQAKFYIFCPVFSLLPDTNEGRNGCIASSILVNIVIETWGGGGKQCEECVCICSVTCVLSVHASSN